MKQYSMFIPRGESSADLWNLTQKWDESMHCYIERFKAIASRVTMDDGISIEALRHWLWYQCQFCETLSYNPLEILEVALHRATICIKIEEERETIQNRQARRKKNPKSNIINLGSIITSIKMTWVRKRPHTMSVNQWSTTDTWEQIRQIWRIIWARWADFVLRLSSKARSFDCWVPTSTEIPLEKVSAKREPWSRPRNDNRRPDNRDNQAPAVKKNQEIINADLKKPIEQ